MQLPEPTKSLAGSVCRMGKRASRAVMVPSVLKMRMISTISVMSVMRSLIENWSGPLLLKVGSVRSVLLVDCVH